jgi:hypothetical protein
MLNGPTLHRPLRRTALRYAYVVEFLLAAIATQVVWAEVGGAGHLELIPWYYKLVGILGLAFTAVQATGAAVEGENAWNSRTLVWTSAAILVMAAMAAVTFYAHVHENDDSGSEPDPTPVAFLRPPAGPGGIVP